MIKAEILQWYAHCSRNGIDRFTSVNTFLKCSIEGGVNKGYTLEAKNSLTKNTYRVHKKSLKKCFFKAQKICNKNALQITFK